MSSEKKFKIPRSIEWTLLIALTGFAIWLRFYNLGRLGLWGDEGFTYLSVEGILKYGWPILPSGNPYLKDILFSYLSAIPAFFFGMSELTVRFTNAFWGVALIPVFYSIVKKYFPFPIALLGALILTLSHWEIEFARHARYYCQLQFFYLVALYFFNRGFTESKVKYQWWSLLFFVFACLTHQLAYTLVFGFIMLLWVLSLRVITSLRILLFGTLFASVVAALQYFELYFWKVGSVAHLEPNKTIFETIFRDFHWGYFRQFQWLFPRMSWVALIGALYYLLYRNSRVSLYFGVAILSLIFMGFGHAHFQPRYVFYLLPFFLLAYLAGIYLFYTSAQKVFEFLKIKWGRWIGVGVAVVVVMLTVDSINPHYSVRLTKHNYGKQLISKFQPSTTFSRRIDYKTASTYVKENMKPDDLVLGMHMVFNQIYVGRLDYWMWSAGPGAWDAYAKEGDQFIDRYLGIPLIRNLEDFQALRAENRGKRIWVITTPSWNDRGHVREDLANFLHAQEDNIQYHSRDGASKAFLF